MGAKKSEMIRLAALGDLHYGKEAAGTLQQLFSQINSSADVLLLAGDLTDYGLPDEAHILAKDLTTSVRIPVVAVLGNHDYESGKHEEVCQILSESGVKVLDGDTCEVAGIGIAGVKGFTGGFGRGTLGYWGEEEVKRFVQAGIDEALKLESALARLRTRRRIALLHYAPIRDTVMGEPPEIFPFLGTSRLEEPIDRYRVDAVFHGHAHNGTFEGRTSKNIPVYNVSHSLLRKQFPNRPSFFLLELPLDDPQEPVEPAASAEVGR